MDSQIYSFDAINDHHIDIYEHYSILKQINVTRQIGTWMNNESLTIYEKSLQKRRTNLMGAHLRARVVPETIQTIVILDQNGNIVSIDIL